ncbi:hypothetical protein [Anabaena sp. PCC 7108]|uniref:hypothetical protein n=1 Tax=Anabaena sp. PCC 7108 TaxID=163908 RepID=UPI0003487222|nr:hypothetical protein [Anabaena sp. PCC 7108]
MNINLTSEVIWNLVLTSLIGLWLIWQAVKINSEIDILKVSVDWFSDRPIILPSLLFLVSPFLSTYIFHNLPPNFNQIFDNKILVQVLTTFGAIISLYIGNRILESFRKTQEQKKIAKILIAGMEAHIEDFEKLNINIKKWISKLQRESLERMFNNIKKDYIYESALKSVGIFEIKYIDIISKYSRKLNHITDEILNIYELDQNQKTYRVTSGLESYLDNLKKQINMLTISALLNSMILSREILQHEDKVKEYKIKIKRKYTSEISNWKDKQEFWKEKIQLHPISPELQILLKEYSQFPEIEHYFKLNLEYFSNSSAQNLNE